MLRYQKGYIFNGCTFVVNKEDVHNAKDDMFVEATALLPDGWISVKEALPPQDISVLIIVNGKPRRNIELVDAYEFGNYSDAEGWIVEAYPEWETLIVTHWMPLPNPPKEGNYEVELQVHDRI